MSVEIKDIIQTYREKMGLTYEGTIAESWSK
jgi:hypothetical protein